MQLETCNVLWHNMAACYATVCNATLEDVFAHCGHDGSQIAWPQLQDPFRRVSFHTQELFDFARSRNYFITPITAQFYLEREGSPFIVSFNEDKMEERFHAYLRNNYGIILVDDTICVWDGLQILSPYHKTAVDYIDQKIELFYMFGRC